MTIYRSAIVSIVSLFAVGLCNTVAYCEEPTATDDVIAVGPLELIENQSVTVLGRAYRTDYTGGLSVGAKVAIHGVIQTDGSVINAWVEPIGSYVAGSDQVYEIGAVSNVNSELGRLTISGSEIDYTNSLADPNYRPPAAGDFVSVSGIQPVAGGVILSDSTDAGNDQLRVAYFGGMRVSAVTGGNLSAAEVTGGKLNKAAVTGGNVNADALVGRGALKSAVTGGNFNAAAVTGGNFLTAAVTGGNQNAAAVTGGNSSTAAVTGGNLNAAAVTGGNATAASFSGGTASKAAVTGGNVYSLAVTGGNKL